MGSSASWPHHSCAAKVSQGTQTINAPDKWQIGQLSCFAKLEALKQNLGDLISKLSSVLDEASQQISIMMQCEQTFQRQLQAMIEFSSTTMQDIKTNTDGVQEMLQQQVFAQQMMENLISDLLDLAKMKNNKFELHASYFNLVATIQNCFQILLPSSQQQKIKFSLDVEDRKILDLVQCFFGDERRFMQILLNFLSNSLKFSKPNSSVRITLAVLSHQEVRPNTNSPDSKKLLNPKVVSKRFEDIGASEEQFLVNILEPQPISKEYFVHLQLTISDQGIGISPQNLKHLFIDFGKLEDLEGRNKVGTGLGLSICKQIIEQMGGCVSVNSEEGVGSNFVIDIKTKCKATKTVFTNQEVCEESVGNKV